MLERSQDNLFNSLSGGQAPEMKRDIGMARSSKKERNKEWLLSKAAYNYSEGNGVYEA